MSIIGQSRFGESANELFRFEMRLPMLDTVSDFFFFFFFFFCVPTDLIWFPSKRLCHLSVRVGDSLRRSEEIVKNHELRLSMRLYYYYYHHHHHHYYYVLLLFIIIIIIIIIKLGGSSGRAAPHHPIPGNIWTEGLSTADRPQKKLFRHQNTLS